MRLTTEAEIQAAMSEIETGNVKVVAVLNNGAGVENNEIISIFNADASAQTVTLPEGEWNVCVNKDEAGTEVLATVSGTVEVEATSAMILVKHVHSYTSEVVEPTCTEDGYTVYTCECGDSYTDDYVEATGHKYGRKGICEICGEKKNQDKPGHGKKPGHGNDKPGKKPHCADTFYNYLF